MKRTRRQLTLFITEPNDSIEKVRAEFNPVQFNLISAHITLCREDEIEKFEDVEERIKSIILKNPIRVEFKDVERFANGKGVLIPSMENSIEFSEFRKCVLGQKANEQLPHITLMHPRNSTCTDEIFEQIKGCEFPAELEFRKIHLIEQRDGGKWNVLQEFSIVN